MVKKRGLGKLIKFPLIISLFVFLSSFLFLVFYETGKKQTFVEKLSFAYQWGQYQFSDKRYVFLDLEDYTHENGIASMLLASIGGKNGCPRVVVIDIVLPIDLSIKRLETVLSNTCPSTLYLVIPFMYSTIGTVELSYYDRIDLDNVVRGSAVVHKLDSSAFFENILPWEHLCLDSGSVTRQKIVIPSVFSLAAIYLESGKAKIEEFMDAIAQLNLGNCTSEKFLRKLDPYKWTYQKIQLIKPILWTQNLPMEHVDVLIIGTHVNDEHPTIFGVLPGPVLLLSAINTLRKVK